MVYPITLEILVSVFSRHGQVLKIITFMKNGTFQALLQMADPHTAAVARAALDMQHIYTGCCLLQITFSKMKDLVVKYNNDKSWDYTNPNLPSQMPSQSFSSSGPQGGPMGPGQPPQAIPAMPQGPASMGAPPPSGAHAPHAPLQPHGPPMHAAYGYPGMPPAFGVPSFMPGMQPGVQPGMPGALAPGLVPQGNPVVLVSNLVADRITCDVLFVLFGVFGDVLRIKIPFKNKTTALVQFREVAQAQIAVTHLNGIPLHGSNIHVQLSKFNVVSMPRTDAVSEHDAELTKDYSNSPLHRYKSAGSKNRSHIYPVSPYLHVSNLPETMTDDEVARAFMSFGAVTSFRRFPTDAKMAVVQLSSTEHAIDALIALHNSPLGTSPHIRISFSKAPTS